jgi:hypothetical protein
MALRKEYEYGTKKGNYWKIIGVHANSMYSNSKVRVALFKDEESRRDDGSSYGMVMPLVIPGCNHVIETAYAELKKKAEFDGAEDC